MLGWFSQILGLGSIASVLLLLLELNHHKEEVTKETENLKLCSQIKKSPDLFLLAQGALNANLSCDNFINTICTNVNTSERWPSVLQGILNSTSYNEVLQKEIDWLNSCNKSLDLDSNKKFIRNWTNQFIEGLPLMVNVQSLTKSMSTITKDYTIKVGDIMFLNISMGDNLILLSPKEVRIPPAGLEMHCNNKIFKYSLEVLQKPNGFYSQRKHKKDCAERMGNIKIFEGHLKQLGKGASDTNVVELSISDFQEQYNDECVYNDSTRVEWMELFKILYGDLLMHTKFKIKVDTEYLNKLCELLKETSIITFVDYVYWQFIFDENVFSKWYSKGNKTEKSIGICENEFSFNVELTKSLIANNKDIIKERQQMTQKITAGNSKNNHVTDCLDFLSKGTDSNYAEFLKKLNITNDYLANFLNLRKELKKHKAQKNRSSFPTSVCGSSYHIKDNYLNFIGSMIFSPLASREFPVSVNYGNLGYLHYNFISDTIKRKDIDGIALECFTELENDESTVNGDENRITLGLLLTLRAFRNNINKKFKYKVGDNKIEITQEKLLFASFANIFCADKKLEVAKKALQKIKEFRIAMCPSLEMPSNVCYLK